MIFRYILAVVFAFGLTACTSNQKSTDTSMTQGDVDVSKIESKKISLNIFKIAFSLVSIVQDLIPEARTVLQAQAAGIKKLVEIDKIDSVLVEGHCDERGTREYNTALGERRANAAKRYLVSQGVNKSVVKTNILMEKIVLLFWVTTKKLGLKIAVL